MSAIEVIASALLLTGALLAVLAALGLLRLPDVGARLQAATKLQVLGLVVLASGAALLAPGPGEALMLALVVLFQSVTAPVLAQLLGRAAHRAGTGEPRLLVRDELRDRERGNGTDAGTPRRRGGG
jgi:multicomponent Na+:H+ antiporter subunit G